MSQASQRGPAKHLPLGSARLSGGNPKATSSSPLAPAPRSVTSPVSHRQAPASVSQSQSPYSIAQTRSPAGLFPNFDILAQGMAMDRSSTGDPLFGGRPNSSLNRGHNGEHASPLKDITTVLRTVLPRSNPSGLEIIAQRAGSDVTFDPEEGTRPDGSKDCYFAGKAFLLELLFESERKVSRVQLTLSGSTDGSQPVVDTDDFQSSASTVLQFTLLEDPVTLGLSNLTAFAANLDRISMLDRVSAGGSGFSAFQAISGVYKSLKKLHDHELNKAASESNSSGIPERTVLSKMSGRPTLNARNTIGVTLDYGLFESLGNKSLLHLEKESADTVQLFSLSIECENTMTYASDLIPLARIPLARVSSSWLSDDITSTLPDVLVEHKVFGASLPWLEPDFTQELSMPTKHGESQETVPKTLASRFIARLDPPVVVPDLVAENIETMVGMSGVDHFGSFDNIYHDLVLGTKTLARAQTHSVGVDIFSKTTRERPDGTETTFHNTLHVPIQGGKKIESLGFSHPKQLVAVLPYLRQWAFIQSLLQKSFKDASFSEGVEKSRSPRVEMKLNTEIPSLDIFITGQATLAYARLRIDTNADVSITQCSMDSIGRREQLARAFVICNDVNVWISWVTDRLCKVREGEGLL